MKVFISADIEGVSGVTHWDEAHTDKPDNPPFREQMSAEVAAACEGALQAGADEVWVKDAHNTARNLIAERLPRPVCLHRGWSGHPYLMLEGLDGTFDGVLMTGYHSPAATAGNPLSHTLSTRFVEVRLNGELASEFRLNAYTAGLLKVPVLFVCGDQGLCDEVKAFNPAIETVAVKTGMGGATVSIHPALAVERIRAGAARALQADRGVLQVVLPEHFTLELRYREHAAAFHDAFYPGARLAGSHTLAFETDDYFEVLRLISFVL